ncbi:energy transducer TonB [Rosenbergiella australiborealis]|uniref:energy transducer TonB n=1 Tax=Rosenbergiella australiborealis TaxID=1544696 RepID=UPI001F4E52E1|nr:energy transducer TonB [Rosenbergiella australiborealis]
MSSLTEELPKRGSIATIVSIALHGAVITGLLYASINNHLQLPPLQQAINVSLVAPEVQPELASKSTPVAPEPVSTPIETPTPHVEQPPLQQQVAIPVEKPKPKPVKKVVHKPVHQEKPKPEVHKPIDKPVEKASTQAESHPFDQQNMQSQARAQTAPQKSTDQQKSISDGKPQRLTTVNPAYPARALALHVEGKVRVRFDVDGSGSVGNIEIISAEPRGMFDREVKQALKRWRYAPGHPAKGQTFTIIFRIDGSSAIE